MQSVSQLASLPKFTVDVKALSLNREAGCVGDQKEIHSHSKAPARSAIFHLCMRQQRRPVYRGQSYA